MAHRTNQKRNFGTASSKTFPVQAPTKPGCFLNTDHLNPDTPFFRYLQKQCCFQDPVGANFDATRRPAEDGGVSWDFHFEIN